MGITSLYEGGDSLVTEKPGQRSDEFGSTSPSKGLPGALDPRDVGQDSSCPGTEEKGCVISAKKKKSAKKTEFNQDPTIRTT